MMQQSDCGIVGKGSYKSKRKRRSQQSGRAKKKRKEEMNLCLDQFVFLFLSTRSKSHEPIQKLTDAKDSISSVKMSDYGILTGCDFIMIFLLLCFSLFSGSLNFFFSFLLLLLLGVGLFVHLPSCKVHWRICAGLWYSDGIVERGWDRPWVHTLSLSLFLSSSFCFSRNDFLLLFSLFFFLCFWSFSAPVTSVCFSGDGNCLLVGTLDSTVRLLDRDKGHLLSSYSGHQNVKYKLDSRLSNTDAHVVSGSEDGSIHFWELVQVGLPSVTIFTLLLKAHLLFFSLCCCCHLSRPRP